MKGYSETRAEELAVDPLTAAERAWLKKLAKLLNSCPSARLELVTIGDPSFSVAAKDHPDFKESFDMRHTSNGGELARISFWNTGLTTSGQCG